MPIQPLFPTPADLAPFRELALLGMPDFTDVRARVLADDGLGGITETWPAVTVDNTPCALTTELTPAEREMVARLGLAVEAEVRLPYAITVAVGDRLTDMTVGGVALGTFEVRAVLEQTYRVQTTVLAGRIGA